MEQSVIHRTITVAPGRFAPGHLGELTQQLPFELVDVVLAETDRTQSRVRDLPARVVVYLLVAGCLFAELGYVGVWQRLCAGLDGLKLAAPTASALTQARRRLGPAPLRALFDLLRGPAPVAATPGVRVGGLLVCAIDGTTLSVADTPANLGVFTTRPATRRLGLSAAALGRLGGLRHPQPDRGGLRPDQQRGDDHVRAAAGQPARRDAGADRPQPHHRHLTRGIAATDAHLLGRCKSDRKLPLLRRLPDGSWLSVLGGVSVRVVCAEITIATRAGRATGVYRLATTLTDPHAWPAATLVTLYHQRWEIETAYLELKSSILGGRVLRARTPAGIDQEVHALLVCYQLLRLAMADATSTQPGIDPDRASFTVALQAARDQLIQAAGVIAGTTVDLAGKIGRAVLDNLLADRRLRVSPRVVKRAISKYNARGPTINRTSYKATLSIDILAPPDP